ncbi:MAG TPA: hypothetical protein PKE51_08075 [Gemmatimonadaceae bacterium]|nr:hypothetical protein [Gemmatimonadaceae bacterium]
MPESSPTSRLLGGADLQELITLGYLYLLAVGIVSDWVYYRHFDLPILSYSDALDVLLSPLTWLEREPRFFATLLAVVGGSMLVASVLRQVSARRLKMLRAATDTDDETIDKATAAVKTLTVAQFLLPAIFAFSGYVGYATGVGRSRADDMRRGELRVDHQLSFSDGRVLRARIVGNNSGFVFYVPDSARQVVISPLRETVVALQRLPSSVDTAGAR